MDLVIKPLAPDLLDDFLYYFDDIAFADNPEWAGCYCHFHHCEGDLKVWAERTKEQNRNASKELILSSRLNGFLAYKKDKSIGWLNIDAKDSYKKLPIEEAQTYPYDGKIASIVCFVITLTQRRKGIARQLLKFACSSLKDKGYSMIEAYPKKGLLRDDHSYHGPESLFLSEGFTVYKTFTDSYVLRKDL